MMLRLFIVMAVAIASAAAAEIDNAWVKVFRVASHEKLQAHAPSVVVYLKSGDVAYLKEGQNVPGTDSGAVLIELKPGAPKSPPIELDPVKLDPEHHLVPLENDRVRVLRTILEPRLKSPMHEHPHYVVVYITDLHTTMKLGDGRVVDNPRKPGEIAWRDSLKHQTENIGEHMAIEIQVELK